MTISPSDQPERPDAVLGLGIHLSALRSMVRVGLALSTKFPTEVEWQEFLETRLFQETAAEVMQLIEDVQEHVAFSPGATPEGMQVIVGQHFPQALEAVVELAGLVEVDETDLLAVIVSP